MLVNAKGSNDIKIIVPHESRIRAILNLIREVISEILVLIFSIQSPRQYGRQIISEGLNNSATGRSRLC